MKFPSNILEIVCCREDRRTYGQTYLIDLANDAACCIHPYKLNIHCSTSGVKCNKVEQPPQYKKNVQYNASRHSSRDMSVGK